MSQFGDQMRLPRGVDTNPLATAIQRRAQEIAPDAFGGFYHEGDVYYVGFTRDLDANLAALRGAFPNVEINAYAARRTASELDAISSAIEATMLADPNGTILYAVPDQVAGIVNVGVSDLSASDAQAIASQCGDAVKVVQDEPLQPLAKGVGCAIAGQACSPSQLRASLTDLAQNWDRATNAQRQFFAATAPALFTNHQIVALFSGYDARGAAIMPTFEESSEA